jgi:S-adenosylmethionine decarboxylase
MVAPSTKQQSAGQSEISQADVIHEARGTHLLLTMYGCSPEILNDESKLSALAERAVKKTGAEILQVVSRKFEPQGVTVLLVLAESHASLHTYPESGVAFWDCFTCGETCKPGLSTAIMVEGLSPQNIDEQLVSRGK